MKNRTEEIFVECTDAQDLLEHEVLTSHVSLGVSMSHRSSIVGSLWWLWLMLWVILLWLWLMLWLLLMSWLLIYCYYEGKAIVVTEEC